VKSHNIRANAHEGNVDEGGSQRKDTDSPQIDGEMRQAIHALDVSNTHEPSSSLLEEIANGLR
jgi:hypothetical protein